MKSHSPSFLPAEFEPPILAEYGIIRYSVVNLIIGRTPILEEVS